MPEHRMVHPRSHIMRTLPRDFEFEAWIDACERSWEEGHCNCYYGMALPKIDPPEEGTLWLYLVWRSRVRARQRVIEIRRFGEVRLEPNFPNEDPMATRGYVLCHGPIMPAPREVPYPGFQGYRYTANLW
jgi:hypothetical protein